MVCPAAGIDVGLAAATRQNFSDEPALV